MQNDNEKPQPLNEDMLVDLSPTTPEEYSLNEDVLKSTVESKERATREIVALENRKKNAMKESVKIIYSEIAKESKTNDFSPIQIKQLKMGDHIAEIIMDGKAYKVGTEEFVKMSKGYFSTLIASNETLKRMIHEQKEETKRLTAKLALLEGRQPQTYTDNGNERLLKEIQELRSRLNRVEKLNEER